MKRQACDIKNHCCLLNYTITSVKIALPMPKTGCRTMEGAKRTAAKGVSLVKNELNVIFARFFISRLVQIPLPLLLKRREKHDEIFTVFLSHYKFQTSTKYVCSRKTRWSPFKSGSLRLFILSLALHACCRFHPW